MSLLRVRDLTLGLPSNGIDLLRGVSLDLHAGEAVGLVGESGCGKSLFALSLLGLLPSAIEVRQGSIQLDGEELVAAAPETIRQIRGRRLAMVFQEPGTALNPLHTIGGQVAEVIRLHHPSNRRAEKRQAMELLDQVGLEGGERYRSYPHELSGGQRQRVVIAIALAGRPSFLVADEPTTALDMTVQLQILDLLNDLRSELGLGLLLISHDLAVIRDVCERAAVLYAGELVEEGSVDDLFLRPAHPYTQGLLAARTGQAVPSSGEPASAEAVRLGLLPFIAGLVPEPGLLPKGCVFAPRCPQVFEPCVGEASQYWTVGPPLSGHRSRCHLVAPDEASETTDE